MSPIANASRPGSRGLSRARAEDVRDVATTPAVVGAWAKSITRVALAIVACLAVVVPAQAAASKTCNAVGRSTTSNSFTTASFDSTAGGGASLITFSVADYDGATQGTVSESGPSVSNTWNKGTVYTDGSSSRATIWYAFPSSTSNLSASHTITYTCTGCYPMGAVKCFTNNTGTSSLDLQAGASTSSGSATLQVSPSRTPTNAGEVVVTMMMINQNGGTDNFSISGSPTFTLGDYEDQNSGQNFAGADGYLIQSTATAVQPTWNGQFVNTYAAVAEAIFVVGAAPGGGGGGCTAPPSGLSLMGVGNCKGEE